ncbi:MAG: hypothetical protein JO257_24310 [Deltaproteobacteria bacterium]|nr:hypothetical protein [Deltaproteobacteria bacterium]
MQLDEVALDALLPSSALPMARILDSDVSIEVLFDDDDMADAMATRQFTRFSSPYERIEVSEVLPMPQRPRRTTFARTVTTLAKGTPSAGVPSVRPTLRMPAVVTPRPTVEIPVARPTVEMPVQTRVNVRALAHTTAKATIAPRPAPEMPLAAPPSATVPFERVWFDDEEPEKLAAIEEPAAEPKTSWWWLAISLAAGGAAVAWMASLA